MHVHPFEAVHAQCKGFVEVQANKKAAHLGAVWRD